MSLFLPDGTRLREMCGAPAQAFRGPRGELLVLNPASPNVLRLRIHF